MAYHAQAAPHACKESIFWKACSPVMNQVSSTLSIAAYFPMHAWNSSLVSFKNNDIEEQKDNEKMMQMKMEEKNQTEF